MGKTDGSITFSTELDNSKLEKELARINKEIENSEKAIYEKEAKKSPLVQQAQELELKIRDARAEVERYAKEWANGVVGADQNQSVANSRLRDAQAEYEKILGKINKIDESLIPAYTKLEKMQEEAGGLRKKLASVTSESSRMGEAVDAAGRYMSKLTNRIKLMAKRVFVFTVIANALRAMKDWMWGVIKTNDEAVEAVAKLKGALLTAAQPIVEVIIPAFVYLVEIMTKVVAVAAQLIAYLFGKTASQSKKAAEEINKQTDALKGVGAAADKASGSLAGFDEINTIRTEDSSGAMDSIVPDFSFETGLMEENMENLLGWIKAIGAALIAWKLSSSLLLSLKETMGLALGIYSAFELVKALTDAWVNGVSWGSILDMLLALTGAAIGFGIAFGPIGAGIALIVGGLAMLVTGFHDAFESGWNLMNLFTSIAGIVATGLGIAILTGSWIPLLIAAIAALMLAFAVETGHGEELLAGVKKILEGFKEFFVGIFTGDIQKALCGISKIFEGVGEVGTAVIDGLRDAFISFLNWLDQKTGGKFKGIINFVKDLVIAVADEAKNILKNLVQSLIDIFQGLTKFLTGVFTNDWDLAWEGVKDIFRGIVNALIGCFESAINLIIRGANLLTSQLNKIKIDIPDWVPEIGGKKFGINISPFSSITLPRLATGAVVPPNREFMAILGDNKKETEIVSPLSTMKQAMLEALQASGGIGGGTVTVVVNLDGKEVARNTVRQINNMTQQAGKSPLLI